MPEAPVQDEHVDAAAPRTVRSIRGPARKGGLNALPILLAAAAAATLLCGWGGWVALAGGVIAQPLWALALQRWAARDALPRSDDALAMQRDLLAALAIWGGTVLLLGLLLAWPMSHLLRQAGLGAALGVTIVAAAALIGIWRAWPLWHAVANGGGTLAEHWRTLADMQAGAWRGLAAAMAVVVVLACIVLLAWPSLLPATARWSLAVASLALWPACHVLLRTRQAPDWLAAADGPAATALDDDSDAANDDDPDAHRNAALYAAARSGRVDRALELLDAGADAFAAPDDDDRDRRTLPMLAAVLPDLRLLRALIGRGVDVNASSAGMTPLLAATRDSWHGRPDAVMTLLANGADPRAADHDGNTPLHHAARSSDPGVAALLRDAAAEVDVLNSEGVTPLGIACAAGNWRLAKFLLERGARPEPDDATPALLAAASGDEDDSAGVALLLRHKAHIDRRDRHGRSALHAAALAGHPGLIATLLSAGAEVDARDAQGRTPLHDSARAGSAAALDALLLAQADPLAVDGEGNTALLLACHAETPSMEQVHRLLALGVDAGHADAAGRRAVDHAAAAGRWSLVAALDPGYLLPSTVAGSAGDQPPPDCTPLALLRDGLHEGRLDALATLLPLVTADELGSLLVDPQSIAEPDRMAWLLAHGANAEVRAGVRSDGKGGDSAMFMLLGHGASARPALQVLLDHAVPPAGAGGLARLLAACNPDDGAAGMERLALDLLERGADPFAASVEGDPPLALAVRLGWMALVERLLAIGVDRNARDSHGVTALHMAAALGRDAALRLLIAQGASPDTRAADGQTPLGVALAGGRRDLADWLDWRGWPLPGRALVPADLPAASIVGDVDAVRRLLDLGMPVDTSDSQGCTALLRAAGGGHRGTVELLLERGADPRLAAHTGATPLSAAVSMRQGEIVDRLLAAGATLEQRLPGDVTVLMLAAALGLPDLCARLLIAGANVQASDAQGLTPLHCAALYGFTGRERPRLLALLDTLLLAGGEADAIADGGVTPLLLLLGARAEPGTACDEDVLVGGLERLLDEDATLDAQDPRGFGVLHLGALHGLLRVTQRLLRTAANPELRDALNRTPREIAIMRGFVDVAAEFAPLQSGVSMARFLREPR